MDGTFGEIVDLEPQEIQSRGGCYVGLHDVPLVADRGRANSSKIEELVESDVKEASLPDVADSGGGSVFTPPPPPVTDPPGESPTTPTFPPEVNTVPMDTGCPAGLPGETCF